MKKLLIGIAGSSILHKDTEPEFSIEEKFRIVSESQVYDYIEKTPPKKEIDEYKRCSEKYNVPIRCGGWYYTLGRDEGLLLEHLKSGSELGSKYHNTQLLSNHANGHIITNEEIVNIYLKAAEYGENVGCVPCLEIHVNMWSEDFLRVEEVAQLVEAKGYTFRMTLDHSHVIFKIDNEEEQKIFDIYKDIEKGKLILDPFIEGNICDNWISSNYVFHMHARSVIPNNPKNIMQNHTDGSVGRGIQYPFTRPKKDEFHTDWNEDLLEPWKKVVISVMKYHKNTNSSGLGQITTEFIPLPDYGGGAKYSIYNNSLACAKWLKKTWREINSN